MASYLERSTLTVPPIRLENPQIIHKRYSTMRRKASLHKPTKSAPRQEIYLGHYVLFSLSWLGTGTADTPCPVSHTTLVVIIWIERQSVTSWEISRSREVWVWMPVVFKFPAQLSASHSLYCSSLFKKLFYSALEMGFIDTEYYLYELRRCLVFTDGTGLYCARHWKLLMIFFVPAVSWWFLIIAMFGGKNLF